MTPRPKRGASVEPSETQRKIAGFNDQEYDEEVYNQLTGEYNSSVNKGEYTPQHRAAIDAYAGHSYQYLNRYLREGGQANSSSVPHADKWQKMADLLHEALDRTTTKRDLVVYRGVKAGAIPKLQVGDEITDHGFISTSMDPGEAQGFGEGYSEAGAKPTIFEVSVPAGTHAVRANEDEHELVLRPGSTMKVVGIENGITKVVLV